MNLERGITLLILLVGLLLVTVGPLRSEPEWDCEALDQVDGERLDAVLDQLIRDGRSLDEATLESYGHDLLPKEALPCLRERMHERMASGPQKLSLRS